MKKSTLAVAALLTVLSAPVVSVAYADEDASANAPAATSQDDSSKDQGDSSKDQGDSSKDQGDSSSQSD